VVAPAEDTEAAGAARAGVALEPDWRYGGGGGGFGCFARVIGAKKQPRRRRRAGLA